MNVETGSLPCQPARTPRTSARRTRPRPSGHSKRTAGARWAIALRQSKTRHTSTGEISSLSVEVQEEACRRCIEAMDAEGIVVEVLIDQGRSGGHGQRRPGRARLLELIDARAIDAVIAFKADRLGRDIEESENLWNRCASAGVLVCATDCSDLSDPVYRSVYFGRAQKDLEDRSDYALAVLEKRRRAGKPPTKAGAAFGYRFSGEQVEVEPDEHAVVQRVFAQYVEANRSMGAIADELSQLGIARRNGSTEWDAAAVSRILYSTWHVGLLPDGVDAQEDRRYWSTGRSFVDADIWRRAQERLRRNTHSGLYGEHPLSGLLFCGVCRGWRPMTVCGADRNRADGTRDHRVRYRCAHPRRHRSDQPGNSIDARRTQELLLPTLNEIAAAPGVTDRRVEQAASESEPAGRGQRLRRRVGELEQRRSRLLDGWLDGTVPDDLYRARMPSLDSELNRLTADLSRHDAVRTRHAARPTSWDIAAWERLPAGRRQDLLRLLLPWGLLVLPRSAELSTRQVNGRLLVRTEHDAAAAASLRPPTT